MVEIPRRKALALLIYLAVSGEPQRRDTLATLLWPDASQSAARAAVSRHLSELRKSIGAEWLSADQDIVALADGLWLDLHQFQQGVVQSADNDPITVGLLEGALALYRDDFLAGFTLPDCPAFDEWQFFQGEELHQQFATALEQMIHTLVDRGAVEAALPHARRWLALDPLHEPAHQTLMRLYAQSGQQAAALRQYQLCVQTLEDELGVPPAAETTALYEQIRTGQRSQGLKTQESSKHRLDPPQPAASVLSTVRYDWREAPTVEQIYGREGERQQLTNWLVGEHCRLISVLGIGGLGKTTLVAQVVRDLATRAGQPFARIFWRSLLNAPPLADLLPDILHFLALPQSVVMPENLDKRLALLRDYVTHERVLLVFDNLESIMEAGVRGGHYRAGYEDYGQLFHSFGQHEHQSCLLLTSREQPQEIGRLVRSTTTVRSLYLTGLSLQASQELLHRHGLNGDAEQEITLIRRYSGHPLALMLVAETIDELYLGDIGAFLAEETLIFDDIRDVLDQHFMRLSPLEQEILTWLAIEREPVTAQTLEENLLGPVNHRDYLEALRSLQRRTLLQSFPDGIGLQNVVTEYTTDRFVEQLCRELADDQLVCFDRYPLLKAQAKEYVRASQARLILQPVTEQLIARSGRDGLLQKVRSYPDRLRAAQLHGYAAGNLLNWLLDLEGELVNLDLSGLTIQQAYLRGKILHDLDLRGAAFKTTVFTETFDILRCLAFSPDGTLLVVGTNDGQLCFWQTRDWLLIQRWHISHDTIRSVAFSPDGRALASADMAGQIQLWDLTNISQANQPEPRLAFERLPSPAWSICFSPDGQTLASGTLDQSLRLWNVATGEMIRILQHDLLDGVGGVCFRPETEGHPRMLASSSYKTVFLWDVDSGEAVQILQGHTDYIWSVCFSPDGKTLASCCSDGTIRLWDTTTWQTRQILTGHTGRVIAMCFSPDGRILASGSSHGTIRLWAVNSGQALQILRGHTNWAAALCFSPDGRTLVSVSGDQSIRLWDMSAASTLSEAEGLTTSMSTPDELVSSHPLQTFQGYRRSIRSVSFSPDGQTVASGGTDGIIRLWDVNDDGAEPRQALIGHQILVATVSFSPDGHTLATGDLRGFLHLWNLAQPATIVGQSERIAPTILAICFSPNSRSLAIGDINHTISIWDLAMGQVIHTLTGHNEAITALAFSPDGKILASANADPTILLWDIAALSTLSEAEKSNTSGASDQIIQRFQEPGRVWSVAFSPDGQTLASGGDAGIIHLWDIASESDQPRQRLAGHSAGISSVAFSPNGRLLVSGGIDRSLRLWDIASGKTIHTLTGHTERVWSVCFSPDGQTVASGSDDGAVKFWDVATGRCLSTRRPDRPYERVQISGVTGLTPTQIRALKELGALDEGP